MLTKKKKIKAKFFEKIKIFTLGNTTVGKSSFIIRFIGDCFSENYVPTTGIDNQTKIIKMDNGKTYTIIFFDTAGQERYNSIAVNSIKNADGILLMYDITNKITFDSIPKWMKSIKEHKEQDFPIILIGNKIDLEIKRKVSTFEGEELAKNYELCFYETSIKDDIKVQEVGLELINQIIQLREKKKEDLYKEFGFLVLEKDSFQLDINKHKDENKDNKENIKNEEKIKKKENVKKPRKKCF